LTILQSILAEIKTDDKTQKVRELCDQIQKEEQTNITHIKQLPKGPNIFLALEVPGRTKKEIAFLTLERETADLYLTILYSMSIAQISKDDSSLKRQKVWEIPDDRPEKILTHYAKQYKFLRGE